MDIVVKSFPDCPCPVCGKDLWAQVELAAWQCETCWPVRKYPPGFRANFRSWKEVLSRTVKQPGFREFNSRFLLAMLSYPPKLATQLFKECREDIVLLGWKRTQDKWGEILALPSEGTCSVCGSDDWWYRPASEMGGPSGRLCGHCHLNPNPDSNSTKEAIADAQRQKEAEAEELASALHLTEVSFIGGPHSMESTNRRKT